MTLEPLAQGCNQMTGVLPEVVETNNNHDNTSLSKLSKLGKLTKLISYNQILPMGQARSLLQLIPHPVMSA